MKAFILILLLSYILSLYSSNSTTSKKLYNLPLYDSVKYNGKYPSLSILDISGLEDDIIYISYSIKRSSFNSEILHYSFTDVYPDEYFICENQTQKSYSFAISLRKRTRTKSKTSKKSSKDLYFEIEKQNKKYLVLENLLYKGYDIEVTHHKHNPKIWIIILIILFFVLWTGVAIFCFYFNRKNKKRIKSEDIDFKKEEPSPLYPPNQAYDSTQTNTIQMQQPPYVPQPIPPEEAKSNDTGYSSGIGQQDGHSSEMGEQGYYSGMEVPSS